MTHIHILSSSSRAIIVGFWIIWLNQLIVWATLRTSVRPSIRISVLLSLWCVPSVSLWAEYVFLIKSLLGIYVQHLRRILEGSKALKVISPNTGAKLPNLQAYRAATQCIRSESFYSEFQHEAWTRTLISAMEQWHIPYRFRTSAEVQNWLKGELDDIRKAGVERTNDELMDLR